MKFWQASARRVGSASKLILCRPSQFLGLLLVKNMIVIEVEVDELHKGKILSISSTSMKISAAAGKEEK